MNIFNSRQEAGFWLAEGLQEYRGSKTTTVVAVSEGGMAIAAEIARILNIALSTAATAPAKALPGTANPTLVFVDDNLIESHALATAIQQLTPTHQGTVLVATPIATLEAVADITPLTDGVCCLYLVDNHAEIEPWYTPPHAESAGPTVSPRT